MESHFSHQSPRKDSVTLEGKHLDECVKLCPELKKLHDFALKRLPSKQEVERSDDEQSFFTSAGARYRDAIELTTLMALRAANQQQNLN
jgi:hypothetical protein